jgi:Ser/Thr protein kinase RdoA (MazF antagonist)
MKGLDIVISHFLPQGGVEEVRPLGNGLINDTYIVKTAGLGHDYVLQRINNAIFKNVGLLQSNIEAVTAHLREKELAAGTPDIDRHVLRFISGADGKTFFHDGESYWRMMVFIPGSKSYESVTPEYSRIAGHAFGRFQAMLCDLPQRLGETIPDFHNMELRIRQLRDAVTADPVGRAAGVAGILADIERRADAMCFAERLHRKGVLPKRVCHCDTKVNNMLFDSSTGEVLCVIDLDTVMPSYIFSDVGDFLRTAANTVAEDDPALEKVEFRMDIFKAFMAGYLDSAGVFLTSKELELLPEGAAMFPYMQAVRFLADYINGDTYYKTSYPEHNLVRTRNQMRLLECIEAVIPQMREYIKGIMPS